MWILKQLQMETLTAARVTEQLQRDSEHLALNMQPWGAISGINETPPCTRCLSGELASPTGTIQLSTPQLVITLRLHG